MSRMAPFSFYKTFLGMNIFILLSACVLLIMSGVVRFWWFTKDHIFINLWRTCEQQHCRTRHDIFKFTSVNKDLDIIFANLIASAGFTFLALFFALCAFCKSKCCFSLQLIASLCSGTCLMICVCWAVSNVNVGRREWAFVLLYVSLGMVTWSVLFSSYSVLSSHRCGWGGMEKGHRTLHVCEDETELMIEHDGKDPDDL